MKYSLWCIVILLLVSGLLQGCSGAVKMEKVKVGEITETKEWTDADGRQHTETTITYICEEQEKTDGPEDKSDNFWLYYITLMNILLLLN
jgi:hypothetical protein